MPGYELAPYLPAGAPAAGTARRATVVAPYTPLWHAMRVLKTSAGEWWEGGVPPARRKRQRAVQAFSRAMHAASSAATGMAYRLNPSRHAG